MTCGIASTSILKVIGAVIASSSQRNIRAPRRVLRHYFADLLHGVLSNGCLDNHLIVDMTHYLRTALFQPTHGFRQDVAGNSLCSVLYQFSRVGLLSAPLIVCADSLKGQ